ncbi:MAG TPA: cobalamin adenosyltransferase [Clostridiales bacterium]|nr:cobalamin adenosyltransferase [Clostridiales bacterium]
MGVLTEAALRQQYKVEELEAMKQFRVPPGTIVTPSARAYLADHKVELVFEEEKKISDSPPKSAQELQDAPSNLPAFTPPKRYESLYGGFFEEKPEHMTALYGPKLVYKDHKVIVFRGKLDSLEAKIIEVQWELQQKGMERVANALNEVLSFVKEILRCEVLRKDLPETRLLNMDFDEIRERSHHPKKYYGINHFFPDHTYGQPIVWLNVLRTQVREAELAAYTAFRDEYGAPTRPDLILGLNRLSSLLYVMMFQWLAGEYKT